MGETNKNTNSWWFCENIINHPQQVGLLRMDFPQVFVLIRNYGENYFASFEDFRNGVAEVNFFRPEDRASADIETILTEAWNFLALTEMEEDRLFEQNSSYKDEI